MYNPLQRSCSICLSIVARQISRLKKEIADLQEIPLSTNVLLYWLPREEYGKYISQSKKECLSLGYCSNLQPMLGVQSQTAASGGACRWGLLLYLLDLRLQKWYASLLLRMRFQRGYTARKMTSGAYGDMTSTSSATVFCHRLN